jgi:flagellar biosynthetic protein FliO
MEWVQQLGAVALVLGLFGAALWALRRRGLSTPRLRRGRRLEYLERLPLGPQHALHLVRVDERELLVASSPGGCWLVESPPGKTLAAGELHS